MTTHVRLIASAARLLAGAGLAELAGAADERWQLSVIGKNLTNRFYFTGAQDGGRPPAAAPAPPPGSAPTGSAT